ncbi:nadp-dependent leukotriene b4 12-hydroxydehydrogenase protein [Penicillium angulare]|uniref:nadp-dependent leukotriene b4 12-hydroxydehydrogenase protein n=1 Tax=Penicillium angulare TaxID=116970 RepID=UPI0025424366|nr:nadp-dependent leukotriene b4 12-hydroxydehydrogenase protein [Penicillium angulare]KAJ5287130.1 nadp-dependent leukotriene b4 12-hydroxydehydrogenase protein [Penicillium angulare]
MADQDLVPNKTWVFKNPPTALIEPGVTTAMENRPTPLVAPPGGIVIKLLIAGLDPHQRDRMRGVGNVDYVPPYEVDKAISNFSIGRVIHSNSSAFEEGSLIAGSLPISEYSILPDFFLGLKIMASPVVWKVSNDYQLDLKHFVGTLGLAGMTAWNAFYGLVKPVAGETIWVNAASSSVGEVVVQLAKMEGMKVIASVSSDEKLAYVINELGADSGFNYREEPVDSALKRLAPEGLDVVFENVGGDHLQAAIQNMKWFGRIISCGTASQYNKPLEEQYGITNTSEIFRRRITIRGFMFWDENIYNDNIVNFLTNMPRLISEGKIKSRYTIFEGIDQADKAFLSMFTGGSFGKTALKISD